MVQSIFRCDVDFRARTRLYGDVHVFNPLSWALVFWALLACLFTIIVAAVAVPFPRIVSVDAEIAPDRGVVRLLVPQQGVLAILRAHQGDEVKAGAVIAVIGVDQTTAAGISNEAQIASAVSKQLAEIRNQLEDARLKTQVETVGAERTASNLRASCAAIARQIGLQRVVIGAAQAALDRANAITDKQFLSRAYVDGLRETLLVREQHLSDLELALSDKRQALSDNETSLSAARLAANSDSAALRAAEQDLQQKLLSNNLKGSYAIRAASTGKVANLRYRVGQYLPAGAGLADIVPAESQLVTTLRIASTLAASVRPGDEIRVAIDSLPSSSFGLLHAKIVSLSSTATFDAVEKRAYFTAVAQLDRSRTGPALLRSLMPDMTGTASVITGRRTALGWLFGSIREARV